jgi:phage shock protein C
MNARFALDKSNAKISGVCAGIARSTDVDPVLVRIGAVLLGLIVSPIVVPVYFVTAWVAPDA